MLVLRKFFIYMEIYLTKLYAIAHKRCRVKRLKIVLHLFIDNVIFQGYRVTMLICNEYNVVVRCVMGHKFKREIWNESISSVKYKNLFNLFKRHLFIYKCYANLMYFVHNRGGYIM